jgi:hypothetical protein
LERLDVELREVLMMGMRMVERGKGGLVMEDERVDGGQQGM